MPARHHELLLPKDPPSAVAKSNPNFNSIAMIDNAAAVWVVFGNSRRLKSPEHGMR